MSDRVLGLNRPAYYIVIGVLLVLSALTAAAMQFSVLVGQEEDLPRLFAIGSSDAGAKEVPLKGTRQNGDITKVSNFKIDFNNVIQIHQGQNLVLFQDSSAQGFVITKVKLINEQKQTIHLDPVSNQRNAFSLNGIPNGVYTLNVVGRLGDIEGGYESILVIIPPDQPTTIINEETKKEVQKRIQQILLIDIYVTIIFEEPEPSPCYFDPSLDECKPVNGKCPPGFGFNEDEQCIPHGKCPDGYGRLDDDETGKCYKNSDIKKCPDGYITHKSAECPKPPPVTPPVNSCGCPTGENCPDVVCDQPPGERILPPTPTPTLTPTPPNEELPPSPPPDTIPPIDEEQPPADEQPPTPPPDEQLLPSDEEIPPPDELPPNDIEPPPEDNTPSEDEEPPEEEEPEDNNGNGNGDDGGDSEEDSGDDGGDDGNESGKGETSEEG